MPKTKYYGDTAIHGYTFDEMAQWSAAKWDYELLMSGLDTVQDTAERDMWEEKIESLRNEVYANGR